MAMKNGSSGRLKILIVGLYPNEACPIITFQLVKAFMEQGHSVTVILPSSVSNLSDWMGLEGVDIKWINTASSNRLKKAIDLAWFGIKAIINGHQKTFDTTFYTFFHSLNLAVTFPFKKGKKVLFLHDPVMHSDEPMRRKKKAEKQVKRMDDVIVHSKSFIELTVENYGLSKGAVHYMPLCLLRDRIDLKAALSRINKDKPISFLFFGRITEYKGIELLIEAYKRLEDEELNCTLTIAGSGDFSKYADAFGSLKNGTLINRYIDEVEIDSLFLKDNCVVVVPYVDATQSGIIDLALSYAVPVISSNLDGLVEQLDCGNLGLLVPPGDAGALHAEMRRLCLDAPRLKSETIGMHEQAKKLDWNLESKKILSKLGIVHN